MNVFIKNTSWKRTKPSNKILVIVPGAGTYANRFAYNNIKSEIIYVGKTGGKYDKYPQNWQNNQNVSTSGHNLGGLYLEVEKIIKSGIIPKTIICGSRGAQVTIGKVWQNIWRGPTIIFNAGSLTTKTIIPKGVLPLFITMGHDYFNSVNKLSKVIKLFYKNIEDPAQKALFIHFTNEYHQPKLNFNYNNFLDECINLLSGKLCLDYFDKYNINIHNIIIKSTF